MRKNVRNAPVRLKPTWKSKPDTERLALALWLLVSADRTTPEPLAETAKPEERS